MIQNPLHNNFTDTPIHVSILFSNYHFFIKIDYWLKANDSILWQFRVVRLFFMRI